MPPPISSSLLFLPPSAPPSTLLLFLPIPTTQKSNTDVGIIAFTLLLPLPKHNKRTECAKRAQTHWAGGQGTPNKPDTPGHILATGRTRRSKHTRNSQSTPGAPSTPTRQARQDTKHTMHIRHTAGTRGNANARYGWGDVYRFTSRQ